MRLPFFTVIGGGIAKDGALWYNGEKRNRRIRQRGGTFMKTIGRIVHTLTTGEGNPRCGEGSFLRLRDGAILYAFTEYIGGSWADDAAARIAGCISRDEGETWSERFVLFAPDEGARNNMSVSLLRMHNGDIGALYLRKESRADGRLLCMPVFRRSADEGKTWSDYIFCCAREGYYCAINDGALTLRDGRHLFTMAYCSDGRKWFGGEVHTVFSSDDGASWEEGGTIVRPPYTDRIGLQEPGVYEYDDGELWMWYRTAYGFQYESRSSDGGRTWSAAEPNFHFTSPDSPMRVKDVGGGITAAVYNPVPMNVVREDREKWGTPKRTPLAVTISRDGGRSYDARGKTLAGHSPDAFIAATYLLEEDRADSYCYPALIGVEGGFLCAYYSSAGTDRCLNVTRIRKVPLREIGEEG